MPQVSVCQTESYDPARMQAAVRAHFEALDLSRQIRQDLKIVIKPNLVMKRAPEDAATTHPALVEAVIRQLQQLGAQDITIAESFRRPLCRAAFKKPIRNLRHGRSGPPNRGETESWHRQPGNRRKRPGHPPFYSH